MKLNKSLLQLLVLLAGLTLIFSGCGREKGQEPKKATSPPAASKEQATPVQAEEMKAEPLKQEVEAVRVAAAPEAETKKAEIPQKSRWFTATSHVVKKDECLWWIAQYREVYNDPWQWPRIYEANRDQIEDPDVIYPGQVLSIPR
jgi:nucleoid-associated protein YgaU